MKYFISSLLLLTMAMSSMANPKGYSIQTIETPPNVLFHITGLDTDKDGNMYCATRYGDVWVYKVQNKTWHKFAEGLHEPCGLLIENDGSLVVTQKPEMTRLIDSNKDGKADLYIPLTREFKFHNNYHEFNFGGVKDNDGNYIGTLGTAAGPTAKGLKLSAMASLGDWRGWAYKVSPEGKFTPIASGLRSPAGLGRNPAGEIFYTDNQGDYVATSTMHQILPNKFYGHPVSLQDRDDFTVDQLKKMTDEEFDAIRTLPVVFIPQEEVANSPGNPEWIDNSGKFGPFKDQFFVGDQTRSNIFRVTLQEVKGRYQGCVIDFISGLQCGNIRLKFDKDGALWSGQTSRGWTSRGSKTFGLQKVVWDKKTMPFEILDVKLTNSGFTVQFTEKINEKSIDQTKISRWWYEYSRKYGAPKSDLEDINASSVKLAADGKTLTIDCPLVKEKVYCLDFSEINNSKGEKLGNTKAYYTIVNLLD
ncbi:probable large, multifunctional secreted protein [Lentisphaera araneosa HTCC2155]|uniref:Probable large, multifunctional secreted protein n=1 Tax=Lentisphaera araneosa HTCC2155 TaxID=313628 RepID=A6DG42_9BACT|nr:hypothetical protein [Lentisphaera araneosa]EDM29159.1 probable large, multifunctional secreted protein [Lentisphaera araneosa HTCC2155]